MIGHLAECVNFATRSAFRQLRPKFRGPPKYVTLASRRITRPRRHFPSADWPPKAASDPPTNYIVPRRIPPPQLRTSFVAFPVTPGAVRGREGDAHSSAVARRHSLAARTKSFVRKTPLLRCDLKPEATFADLARTPGRDTVADQHASRNLDRRSLVSSSDEGPCYLPAISEKWGHFRVLRKILLGQRRGEIILLGRFHVHLRYGLLPNLQLTETWLRKTPYFQQCIVLTTAKNIINMHCDGSYSASRCPGNVIRARI